MPVLSEVEEYEELSLKILAMLLHGDELIGLDCATCTKKVQNNCEMDADSAGQVYYHDHLKIDINTCPLNCILPQHFDFYDRYHYYTTTTATMPDYDDCPAWFWRLYRKFDGYKKLVVALREAK